MAESFTPGATVVGLVFKNGVVLAAEKRVTYGFMLLSRAGKKIFKITERIGIAAAGLISDMQTVAKVTAAEVRLYELEKGRRMSIRSVAKLVSYILSSNRLMPYYTELLVGGVDNTGPHLYVLDPLGALIEDKYVTLGTGAKMAIGILESEYREDLSKEEAVNLAIKAIKMAVSRDAISGDGIDLLVISTDEGLEERFIPLKTAGSG
ncbi:MAG: archaeal proteasome endopeptidase complex subunit beta [Thermoproteales archaeon]|nr:archaeal proteasome endopeptidase complex subunit beta [Thermoproteales archaeon]RLE66336.1 MAG: proteasome endopeptidase complex, archaeal, beta subunit [Thermoprotei archaeon]